MIKKKQRRTKAKLFIQSHQFDNSNQWHLHSMWLDWWLCKIHFVFNFRHPAVSPLEKTNIHCFFSFFYFRHGYDLNCVFTQSWKTVNKQDFFSVQIWTWFLDSSHKPWMCPTVIKSSYYVHTGTLIINPPITRKCLLSVVWATFLEHYKADVLRTPPFEQGAAWLPEHAEINTESFSCNAFTLE